MNCNTYLAIKAGMSLKDYKKEVGSVEMGQRAILSVNTARAVLRLRYDLGFTQAELAGNVGVSVSTVKTWEAGRALPSPKHYRAIMHMMEYSRLKPEEVKIHRELIEAAKEQDLKTAELKKRIAGSEPPLSCQGAMLGGGDFATSEIQPPAP